MTIVHVRGSEILFVCSQAARDAGVDSRTLRARTLLHLPKIANHQSQISLLEARAEIARIVSHRQRCEHRTESAQLSPVAQGLSSLHFDLINESSARTICTSLHYLGTYREGSIDFGLFKHGDYLPTAYCSISSVGFDSRRSGLAQKLRMEEDQIAILSRGYTSPHAPRNTVSYLLARVRRFLRRHSDKRRVLVTSVDSNLGFSGASYVAAGWKLLTTRTIPAYRYINGEFITDRQVFSRFNTLDSDTLHSVLGASYGESRCALNPRLIFGVAI